MWRVHHQPKRSGSILASSHGKRGFPMSLMRTTLSLTIGLSAALMSLGCSSSSSGGGMTAGEGGASSGGSASGGGSSSGSSEGGGCSGATPIALTVNNYLSWCSVSVAGGAASSAASQTVCVASGSVDLTATALSGFVLGPDPWHGTSGDTGSGDPGTLSGMMSTAKVNASGTAACAWVCCPFTNGTGCPTMDQCK